MSLGASIRPHLLFISTYTYNNYGAIAGKPFNPYINSGALMSAALILKLVRPDLKDMASKFDFVHNFFRDMAGGEHVGFNNSSFLAERNMADRNFSLAYFMRENGCFPQGTDINKVLEFYCQVRKNRST